jgi:hypothetical protein
MSLESSQIPYHEASVGLNMASKVWLVRLDYELRLQVSESIYLGGYVDVTRLIDTAGMSR